MVIFPAFYQKIPKGRDQKAYFILLRQADEAIRYWFGRLTSFIRTKAFCKVERRSYKAIACKVNATDDDEQDEQKRNFVRQSAASQDPLRFNGALPMQTTAQIAGLPPLSIPAAPVMPTVHSAPIMISTHPVQMPSPHTIAPIEPATTVINNPNLATAANDNNNNAANVVNLDAVQDKLNEGWLVKTVGDYKLFAQVCVEAGRRKRKRVGAKALETEIGIGQSVIDRYLKFIQCLVNRQRPFSTITNLDQDATEFTVNTLGYPNYAALFNAKAKNGYGKLTTAHVEQLLK